MSILTFDHILAAVVLGFIIDLFLGDPRWLYHPVRLIGLVIEKSEKQLRSMLPKNKSGERLAGTLCAVWVILVSTVVPVSILYVLYHYRFWMGFLVEIFWCYQLLATRSLRDESMRVYERVKANDLEGARQAVSMIVGRDTQSLDLTGVTKAATETVAENASDGVVAPLLFMLIAGAPGGFFYKSINTMDSMIGYRNEKYRYFGTFAAKLDDVVNFLPARISGILMVLACPFTGFDMKNAWKIFLRDRKKHDSPNSAHTEAATAGALRIQLAGDAWYFGKLHKKQTLGDPLRPIEPEDIPRANKLMTAAAVLALILGGALRIAVLRLI